MNKVTLGLVLLVALLGFLLLTTDNGCMASKRPLEVSSVVGSSNTATVEVSASESHKYEANEFLTVARLELHGKDKELLFKQLTSRRFSIFEQMRVLAISEADIEQNSIEMRKEWSYDKGTRSLTGYVVSQSFAIKSSSRSVAAAAVAALSAENRVLMPGISGNALSGGEFQNGQPYCDKHVALVSVALNVVRPAADAGDCVVYQEPCVLRPADWTGRMPEHLDVVEVVDGVGLGDSEAVGVKRPAPRRAARHLQRVGERMRGLAHVFLPPPVRCHAVASAVVRISGTISAVAFDHVEFVASGAFRDLIPRIVLLHSDSALRKSPERAPASRRRMAHEAAFEV